MKTLNKYRVFCISEQKYLYIWNEVLPTACPTNNAHSIDSNLTAIVDSIVDTEVKIKEESIKTGGSYQAIGLGSAILPNVGWVDLIETSWPYPINILSAETFVKQENHNDEIELLVSPNTIIGAITSDIQVGDKIFNVQQSVLDNVEVGYFITLSDGVNSENCGRCVLVDKQLNQITVESGTLSVYSAASPTYVQETIKMVYDITLIAGHKIILGESKIGASYLPANTVFKLRYNNKDGVSKRFDFILEYLY